MTDKEKALDRRLRYIYDISLQDYNLILKQQNFLCAICKKGIVEGKNRFAVDHKHKDPKGGLIRGLLCWQCNKGLSFFKDNIDWFKAAAEYLLNPPATIALGKEVYTTPGADSKKRRKLRKKLRKQCQKK